MDNASAVLQDLVDRDAIERVLIKYSNSLSARDFDGVASCFAKECSFAGMAGREGVRNNFVNHFGKPLKNPDMPLDQITKGTYYVSNIQIEVKGDTAKAFSFGRSRLVDKRGNEIVVLVRGFTYTDQLIREDGQW